MRLWQEKFVLPADEISENAIKIGIPKMQSNRQFPVIECCCCCYGDQPINVDRGGLGVHKHARIVIWVLCEFLGFVLLFSKAI